MTFGKVVYILTFSGILTGLSTIFHLSSSIFVIFTYLINSLNNAFVMFLNIMLVFSVLEDEYHKILIIFPIRLILKKDEKFYLFKF